MKVVQEFLRCSFGRTLDCDGELFILLKSVMWEHAALMKGGKAIDLRTEGVELISNSEYLHITICPKIIG